jgi:type IV secretory pathway VirB9-like protein
MHRRIAPLAFVALALAACSSGGDLPVCTGAETAATPPGLSPVVWDDGRHTFFRFPGNQRIPQISPLTPDGREGAANSNTSGDLVEMHQVAERWALRDGRKVACVRNLAFNPVGVRPDTGTSSPDVERVARAPRVPR